MPRHFWFEALVDPKDVERLRRIGKQQPAVIRKTVSGSLGHVRGKLVQALKEGGGVAGVPPFQPRSDVTLRMKGGKRWGGLLTAKRASPIGTWFGPGRSVQYIGFKDALRPALLFGQTLQTSRDRYLSSRAANILAWRHKLPRGSVPKLYSRPARPMIRPFARWLKNNARSVIFRHLAENVRKSVQAEGKK